MEQRKKLKIVIIGAGFSGTALAASLAQDQPERYDITLIDKRAVFGLGEAYSTPYPYHLLNVRAHDMSAFEHKPGHFVEWLQTQDYPQAQLDQDLPLAKRFAPRCMYGKYLQSILSSIPGLQLISNEAINVIPKQYGADVLLQDGQRIPADKVVLALGNGSPSPLPFSISGNTQCISSAWDFVAPTKIPQHDNVLIVGTGLSMIDVLLTLHHQHHQGKIYAISRHGLVPLPHTEAALSHYPFENGQHKTLCQLTKYIRHQAKTWMDKDEDWRAVIQALRLQVPDLWSQASPTQRKQFLRHVLPYWNVHRHRVHQKLAKLLVEKEEQGQLHVLAGRVLDVVNETVTVKLRHHAETTRLSARWLINCTGPAAKLIDQNQTLVSALQQQGLIHLDDLHLGFATMPNGKITNSSGQPSTFLYSLGPPTKGVSWETSAVPDIRKQCLKIVEEIRTDSLTKVD